MYVISYTAAAEVVAKFSSSISESTFTTIPTIEWSALYFFDKRLCFDDRMAEAEVTVQSKSEEEDSSSSSDNDQQGTDMYD